MPKTISKYHIDRHQAQQNRLNSQLPRFKSTDIYFARHSQQSFHQLSTLEQERLLSRLKLVYSQILFDYFSSQDNINNLIDRFVAEAFCFNLPINKVVEIHMSLMDNLEQQLISQGLHTEDLDDFRLTLIDVIAHLGEMYRNLESQ